MLCTLEDVTVAGAVRLEDGKRSLGALRFGGTAELKLNRVGTASLFNSLLPRTSL